MKNSDDDIALKEEYDFSNGVRGRFYSPSKVSTSIRLDNDVILFFKKKASEEKIGYQTLLNMALREYINHHLQ
ncbi:MAG TPA: BrnA antitoxin family protein [Spirochaetales bacterium]|nr:BrnA antitoxin family protein [Spirochaetales bacterium]HPM73978.1 BrnA antitoxin family protein [Spirochaetales bacterium]